ncbi:response regulator [Treponema sp.]|uniref:response regulator n=1 Tax=Treponema sp. TaxID=166 RepID=UPI00389080AB
MQNIKAELNDTTRFLANTLHEIRTPIQTIIGAVELMEGTSLDKEQTEYIRQIHFSAESLLELANNILDLSKINQKEFKLEIIPFDIAYVTEHVVDSESVKSFNRGVELVLDISSKVPAMVVGDSMRIRQVMINLISNAVKFTNSGYVHVELDYSRSEGIRFTVTDSGIGISADKQKKLFTDYFQADISTYRLFGGTGLGLSISKNLINLMNGKIGVKSNPSGGSIFWFTVPLPVAIEKSPKIKLCNNPEDYRILIADDNELAALSLKEKLKQLGFKNVEIALSDNAFRKKIVEAEEEHNQFKIVFVDMIMPGGIDGWHIAFNLVNSPKIKSKISLYLLVPEGQMKEDAKMKFLELYKGYLYKPVKKDMLVSLLSEEFSGPELLGNEDMQNDNSSEVEELVPVKKVPDKKVAEGLKILVAEDHPMNSKLLETFLKRFGADVYLAENGEEALEIIKQNPEISMVFMDIYMPKKNGIETTKELRSMHYNEIIIACTANNDTNDFAEYKRIGINDILVKPFKSENLRDMIEKWKEVMKTISFEQINLFNIGNEFFVENTGNEKK